APGRQPCAGIVRRARAYGDVDRRAVRDWSCPYYRSPEFRGLKETTQRVHRNIIERFRALHGDKPLKGLAHRHINEIKGAMVKTREAANNLLKVLRVMLDYAVDQEIIASNPAANVSKYKSRGEGIHTWSDAEIAQFEQHHSVGSKPRLAL